jgi:hypothetical protein
VSLSEDQRALLRLLLSGESYESIAGLLGVDREEVRRRAQHAVARIEPSEGELADASRARLAELDGVGEPAAAPPPARSRLRSWLPFALGVAGALAIALIVAGVFEDEAPDPGGSSASIDEDVVEIALRPVGGTRARGTARLLRVADLPALDLEIAGLAPSSRNESYIVWLYNSPTEAFPLLFQSVGTDGRLEGRGSIPSAATALLPSFDGLDVSLADRSQAAAAVRRAAEGEAIPHHVGRSVARGSFPRQD